MEFKNNCFYLRQEQPTKPRLQEGVLGINLFHYEILYSTASEASL